MDKYLHFSLIFTYYYRKDLLDLQDRLYIDIYLFYRFMKQCWRSGEVRQRPMVTKLCLYNARNYPFSPDLLVFPEGRQPGIGMGGLIY